MHAVQRRRHRRSSARPPCPPLTASADRRWMCNGTASPLTGTGAQRSMPFLFTLIIAASELPHFGSAQVATGAVRNEHYACSGLKGGGGRRRPLSSLRQMNFCGAEMTQAPGQVGHRSGTGWCAAAPTACRRDTTSLRRLLMRCGNCKAVATAVRHDLSTTSQCWPAQLQR